MKAVFENNPTWNKLYVFEDGTCFGEKNHNDALNYASKNKLTFETIERGAEPKEETQTKKKK